LLLLMLLQTVAVDLAAFFQSSSDRNSIIHT
jgi:hypothetical protein